MEPGLDPHRPALKCVLVTHHRPNSRRVATITLSAARPQEPRAQGGQLWGCPHTLSCVAHAPAEGHATRALRVPGWLGAPPYLPSVLRAGTLSAFLKGQGLKLRKAGHGE